MYKKKAFLILIGILLIVFFAIPTFSFANSIQEINLSQNNAFGPRCLIRTPDKTIHVVYWQKENGISKLYYINSKDEGSTWAPAFLLSQNYQDSQHACLTADETGQLYVFWADSGKILYSNTKDAGKKWSPIYKVSGRYDHADNPSAIISQEGDIHAVFESDGEIFYRCYKVKDEAWSTLYNLSQTAALSRSPQVAVASGEFLGVLWIEDGEIAFREMVLPSFTWDKKEIISREAESLYTLKKKANIKPQILIDNKKRVHALWANGSKIIHRLRVKEFWSPAPTLLTREAMPWFGAPTCTFDTEDNIYSAWIEKGKTILRQYDSARAAWGLKQKLPARLQEGFQSVPILGPAWTKEAYKPKKGFDLIFIRRTSLESKDYQPRFYSSSSFIPASEAPIISSVTQTGGRLAVSWQTAKVQSAFRLIVGNSAPVVTPYAFDSGIINDSAPTLLTKAFAFSGNQLYIQVKVADRNGNWSNWSEPYKYQVSLQHIKEGPGLRLKGIEENSLYLYSPSPNILFFGNGLDSPKAFTIFGSAIGKNSGIKEITFSKFGNNTPPPITNPESSDWEVQYSIQSADTSGEIIITATDYNGNISQARVNILKDSDPPAPPLWVRINPDREEHQTLKGKKYNRNKVYIFWKNGSDKEAGLRYHVMGTSNQWWKNSVHRSGDSELAHEGTNTFYVFAVDNVGNVSAPGTDTIFIDTVPPFAPKFFTTMTSTNILYGSKSPDTIEILVDGSSSKVALIATTDWKYLSDLKENETKTFSLQAIDNLENKSEIVTVNVTRKSTPPEIFSISHQPLGVLRGHDIVTFKLKGDPGQKATVDIPKVGFNIPLEDDGKDPDAKKNDGEYTGAFEIKPYTPIIDAEVKAILTDQAGNKATKIDPNTLKVDSSRPVLLDDFEILGKAFPWTNHALAKNIDSSSEKDIAAKSGGTGVLKVEYDLAGQQNWAAFSSREFLPKNCFGLYPKLSFLLKGSGSPVCKAAIKIRTKDNKTWNREIKEFPSSEYTFPLSNKGWQRIEMPIPKHIVDHLDQVTQYSLILYSPNNKEKGTFYLDDLKIVYKGTPRGPIATKTVPQKMFTPADRKEISFTPDKQIPTEMVYPEAMKGEFIPAPYLSPIFYPNPIRAGSPVRVKIEIPAKYKAVEVAVLLMNSSGKLISSQLQKTNDNWWHGVTSMPSYINKGNYFGTLYIKTSPGHYLKTRFPFQVIDQGSSTWIDRVVPIFYPHPLIPGVGSTIKIKVPRSLKAKKVAIFFGESGGKANIAELYVKNITNQDEYWFGSITLPKDLTPGDYSALIYIRTRENQFYKKKIKYSVLLK
ncbi:hypothetical protein ACFL5G_02935 [Candidatus Margulisiibacteriota bacterium]